MSNRVSSLTIADGVFTPAVSVTSAVVGIGVAKPAIIKDTTGISIVGIQPTFWTDVNRTTGLFSGPLFGTTIWNVPFGFHLCTKYFP